MLYFDEAGYTGADLTNKIQPFFTLASVNFTKEELERIKNDIDYKSWGRELHYKNMYTNYKGRNLLERIFTHPLMDESHVKLAFAQKRFCIYAQIVNILVETFYHEHGFNLYQGFKTLVLSNGLYYGALVHPRQMLVEDFEVKFVRMVRETSSKTITDFYEITNELMRDKDTTGMFYEMLSEIPQTIQTIKIAMNNDSFYMDLTVPLFCESVQHWYRDTGVKHDVLFDNSEPFYASHHFLESLRDMDVEETKVGYGNSNKHVYPLPVGNLSIGSSHKEIGIQLADVCASALNFLLTPRKKMETYKESLLKVQIFKNVKINIAPSTLEFISEKSKDKEGIDAVDFIVDHINPDLVDVVEH